MLANEGVAVRGRTQEERSAATRRALLEAGRQVILELGYSGATVAEVSKRAGVSRGAQIHHYPTKQKLMLAVADYILTDTEKQISDLARQLDARADRSDKTGEALEKFVSEIWYRAFRTDKFHAILELINASRTDPILHGLLAERWRRLLKAYDEIGSRVLGHLKIGGAEMSVILNLTLCLIRGMATQRIVSKSSKAYYDRMLGMWAEMMNEIVGKKKTRFS